MISTYRLGSYPQNSEQGALPTLSAPTFYMFIEAPAGTGFAQYVSRFPPLLLLSTTNFPISSKSVRPTQSGCAANNGSAMLNHFWLLDGKS